jgi:CRISPR-associated protein Cas5d
MSQLINVRVWGDWACFTRPEMKVERVSYSVITPSAARGIMEAIFWEPQMYYLIDSIRVVKRGLWVSFRRNEVTEIISLRNAGEWMTGAKKISLIQAGGGAPDGTQRNMLALESVEYIISAEVRLTELGKKSKQPLAKYQGEILQRVKRGKCFHRPYLGVREFAADFEWEEDAQNALEKRQKELGISEYNEELGIMLYDVFDPLERIEGFRWLSEEEKKISQQKTKKQKKDIKDQIEGNLNSPNLTFFRAKLNNSLLDCHPDRVTIIRHK